MVEPGVLRSGFKGILVMDHLLDGCGVVGKDARPNKGDNGGPQPRGFVGMDAPDRPVKYIRRYLADGVALGSPSRYGDALNSPARFLFDEGYPL